MCPSCNPQQVCQHCHKCHTSCDRPSWQPPLTVVTLTVTLPAGVTWHCTDLQELGLAAKQEGLRRRLGPFLCSTALTWVAKLGYFSIFLAIILKKRPVREMENLKEYFNILYSLLHLRFLFKSSAICCELWNFLSWTNPPNAPRPPKTAGSPECSCS